MKNADNWVAEEDANRPGASQVEDTDTQDPIPSVSMTEDDDMDLLAHIQATREEALAKLAEKRRLVVEAEASAASTAVAVQEPNTVSKETVVLDTLQSEDVEANPFDLPVGNDQGSISAESAALMADDPSQDMEVDDEIIQKVAKKSSASRKKFIVMDSSDDEGEEDDAQKALPPKPKPLILEDDGDADKDEEEELPAMNVAVEEHQLSLKAKEPMVALDMTDAEAAQTVHDIIHETSKLLFDDDQL
jgi:hypothetical protein